MCSDGHIAGVCAHQMEASQLFQLENVGSQGLPQQLNGKDLPA